MGCASSSSVLKQNATLNDLVEALRKELDATKKVLTDRIVKIENDLENDVELVVDDDEEESVVSEPVPDRRIHFLNFSW